MEELNTEQKKALDTISGTVIINAGPGTGKTKTLVARIEHLVRNHQVRPENILALTFTQKAAAEMRDRLSQRLPGIRFTNIHTYHAFALGILQQEGKSFTIVPEEERDEILKDIASKQKDMTKRDVSLYITRYKSAIHTKQNDIVDLYNSLLSAKGYVDFDDMLLYLYDMLDTDSVVRERVQTRFKHIHVDEFQDTNIVQYRILQRILTLKHSFFVIGDPRQSIYLFRGADPEIFSILKADIPDAEEITLQHNYRSGSSILGISANLFPVADPLKVNTPDPGDVLIVDTLHEFSEADFIVNEISSLMGGIDLNSAGEDNTVRFSDFAVIFRTHAAARVLEQKFADSALPYQVIGTNSLYEQKEIRCITAWLLYLYSKNATFLETAVELSPKKISAVEQNQLEKAAETEPISTLVLKIEEVCDLMKQMKDNPSKIRNVNQFRGNLLQFDSFSDGLERTVKYLLFLKDHEYYDPTGDKVTLMTIHAAKGLEFDTVFICGLEEGNIPLIRKDEKMNEGEERRLLYVAMTRAKRRLYLLRTRTRNKEKTEKSSFEKEFDKAYYQAIKDEMIDKIAKKAKKSNEKKAQMSLF